ncbi:Epimerase domain-containing protein [Mycena kentingensis (nom. inval.)]|nr:Epimerase domain-containing protein [Mycena kentingensis (nom. inval.)]
MSAERAELILVTGATGFLGAHVVEQLLERGYRVRAYVSALAETEQNLIPTSAARGNKADKLRAVYADMEGVADRVELVEIADMATTELGDALVGVDAVMHLAMPMAGKLAPEEQLDNAVNGILNIVGQAEEAGVRKIVVASSIATVANSENTFGQDDWSPLTREMALTCGVPILTYCAAKKFAELALWEWAEKHPHVEVTTINPPFFYGPFAAHSLKPAANDFAALSTNLQLYNLLFRDGTFPSNANHYIDVRDAAAVHVRALDSNPNIGRKRVIVASPEGRSVSQILAILTEHNPALAERVLAEEKIPEAPWTDTLPLDFKRVENIVGMRKEEFRTPEETFRDTVDALLEVEKHWKEAGVEIGTPPVY